MSFNMVQFRFSENDLHVSSGEADRPGDLSSWLGPTSAKILSPGDLELLGQLIRGVVHGRNTRLGQEIQKSFQGKVRQPGSLRESQLAGFKEVKCIPLHGDLLSCAYIS